MTEQTQIVAAIDIGTTKIVAIIAKILENGKVEVLGYGHEKSIGVKRGLVLNIDETVKSIRNAVNKAEQEAGITLKDVYVGIAGEHIKSLRTSGYITIEANKDVINHDDVERLKATMHSISLDVGQEIIHIQPQNYTVDKESGITNPIGVVGKRLEANFHIVIGDVAAANHLKTCINKAGLNLKNIFLEPFASSESVLTEDEKSVGVALVDIGGGTTDLAVYCDGVIQHTAVIPFGGQCVTEDLRKEFGILEPQAESMKINFGNAISSDKELHNKRVTIKGISGRPPREFEFYHIAGIIEARMTEIMEFVNHELLTTGMIDKIGAGIVLTGGGSMIKNLSQLTAYITGKDVRTGSPKILHQSEKSYALQSPMYATSIGLLINGYNEQNEYNLQNNLSQTKDDIEIAPRSENNDNSNTPTRRNRINGIFEKFIGFSIFECKDHSMNSNT